LNGLVQVLRSLGAGRIAAMGAVTLALIGVFAFMIVRFTSPQMAPLFGDLTLADSAAVTRELDQQNIPYELRQDGGAILVPRDQIAKLRMQLAEKRLPSGGGVGWEIFDKGDGFSTTSFVQNVNQMRALEGELARSIGSLDRVASARVHLVIPERPLFTRDAPTPSASIVIRARGDLGAGEIRAIRHLVASAVQNLKPEKVSLIDEAGRLLADGAESEDAAGAVGDERIAALEKRLRERVEAIIGRVVGADRARVEVRAEIDRTKSTVTSDRFDPESRVVRSTQTREENSQSTEPADQAVSVSTQLPNAAAQGAPGAQAGKEASNKSEEVVNYEISRTTRTEVQDGGRVKRLSVAVLVDGVYSRAANGDVTYAPRPQEELDRLTALARSAIGFDQSRGDTVEVVNLRFADLPGATSVEAPAGGFLDFLRQDLIRWVELGVLSLLAVLVLLLVVRPLVRKILAPEAGAAASNAQAAVGAVAGSTTPALAPPAPGAPEAAIQTAQAISAAEIAGQIQAASLERIGELVRNNPNESVAIVRQWLKEAA
jgi:flagellar M-ring protein FliF